MKQQIIDLWKISFGDTDDFIRLYFDRVYKDEQTLVIRKNDRVVSALQILPYQMTYCGTTIPVGYIYGVCTLPSERGKGLMKKLMLQALEEMRLRGYALSMLIPATPQLFDVYRRFEFANAFDYAIEDMQAKKPSNNTNSYSRSFPNEQIIVDCPLLVRKQRGVTYHFPVIARNEAIRLDQLLPDTLYSYYHKKQLERDCCILHSATQFEIICQDRQLGGGEIWVAISDEQLVGLAFTDPFTNDTLSIREIMCNDIEINNKLVQSILNHHQLNRAKLRIPPTPSHSIPYGMARIINKAQMVDLHVQSSRFKVQGSSSPPVPLSDRDGERIQNSKLPDNIYADIPLLTQKLLHYDQRRAYMNLMLD